MLKRLAFATALSFALVGAAAAAETPRKGGTVRFVAPYGSSFSGLDILASQRTQDEIFARAIHRSLYKWSFTENTPVLDLATEDKVSSDGLTHTYKLRNDAYFHNGRKMTADDIIWTYNHIMDGKKAYPGARSVRIIKGAVEVEKAEAKEISGLKKIDDVTLQVTLSEKVDPRYYLWNVTTSIYPPEEAVKESFATHPIGLGPFKFVEHVPGSRMVVERFDKYYEPGKPYADKIDIMVMGEAAARDVAFRNKEIDVSILGPAQYLAYQADPNLAQHILEVPEMYTRVMGMNQSFKPFSDKRVRQAINYAINTDLIIQRLAKGKAYRATSWLPSTSPAYDKDLKPYPYDPEKAKKLLAEAGYPNGFEFEWTATQNESWGLTIVEAVIPMLEKVGIKVKVKPVEDAVLSEVVRKGDFQAFIWSLQTGPDPLAALKCFDSRTPQSACNYTGYKNPAFDKLLDDAVAAGEEATQLATLKKANAFIEDEAPMWFFNYNKAVMAYQPWLHGLKPDAAEMAIQPYEDMWVDETSPAK